jgi:hypothetical protein
MSPCRYGNDINKTIHFEKKLQKCPKKITMFQFRVLIQSTKVSIDDIQEMLRDISLFDR